MTYHSLFFLCFQKRNLVMKAFAAAAAKSLQSCPTLCNPIDGRPSGSPVPGILQARTLEWIAISFSNAWKWKVKVKLLSHVRLLVAPWTAAYQAPPSMGFSRQEYWSGVPLPSLEGIWGQLKTFETLGFPDSSVGKELPCSAGVPSLIPGSEDLLEKGQATHSSILGLPLWFSWQRICPQCGIPGFNPWVWKIPWGVEKLPTPVFWPGEFHV